MFLMLVVPLDIDIANCKLTYHVFVILDWKSLALHPHVRDDTRVKIGHVDVLVVRRRVIHSLDEGSIQTRDVPPGRDDPRLANRHLVRLVDVALKVDFVLGD